MSNFFNSAWNLIMQPFEWLLKIYEPLWNWLVKHDKYVYVVLFIILLLSTFN